MQQLNSLYRGDNSESLGQIMGGQYSPQNQLNQFTSNWAIAGMQGVGATNRLAMQLDAQKGLERDRLREQARSTNLNYILNEGRLGMDMAGQQFNQMKDVATFNQNKVNQEGMLGVAQKNAETARITALDPAAVRANNDFKDTQGATAEWDIYDTELDSIMKGLDKTKDATKLAALQDWRTKLQGWKVHPNSIGYLRAFRQSRMSNPLFGMVNAGKSKPAELPDS